MQLSNHSIWPSKADVRQQFSPFSGITIKRQPRARTLWLKTRMGVRMFKVYCSSEVKQRCKVYLTWKVRGLRLVYFTTDISSQEKWVVKQTRKWGSWVEVTAVTQADTNRQGAGEGHRVMKRTILPHADAQKPWCPSRVLKSIAVPTRAAVNSATDIRTGTKSSVAHGQPWLRCCWGLSEPGKPGLFKQRQKVHV